MSTSHHLDAASTPARNQLVFSVLEQTRRQVTRNPPAGVSKHEASKWWSENVARIARELHRQHLPKRPLRETYQPLAAPRPGQRRVAPVADRWVEAMGWAEILLSQAGILWDEPETRSSWERWRSLGLDQDGAHPLGDLLGVPDVLPTGPLTDSDRDDLAALALRLHAHTLGAWDLHGEAWQAGRGDSATRMGSDAQGGLAPWAALAVLADGLSGARKAHLTAVSPRDAAAFVRQHHSKLPEANLRGLLYALGVRRGARLVCVGLVNTPTGRWAAPNAVVELTRKGLRRQRARVTVGIGLANHRRPPLGRSPRSHNRPPGPRDLQPDVRGGGHVPRLGGQGAAPHGPRGRPPAAGMRVRPSPEY